MSVTSSGGGAVVGSGWRGEGAVHVDLWTGGWGAAGNGCLAWRGFSGLTSVPWPAHKLHLDLDGWGCAPPAHTYDYET